MQGPCVLVDEVALSRNDFHLGCWLSNSVIVFLYLISRIAPVTLLRSFLEDTAKNSFFEVNGRKRFFLARFGVLDFPL